jgi:hypothetical protein
VFVMPGIRSFIAARRKHRYGGTYPWQKLNTLLIGIFDAVDCFTALSGAVFVQSRADSGFGRRTLHFFRRIVHRHVADLGLPDRGGPSNDIKESLLKVSSIRSLQRLYPHVENVFGLKYLDFLYWQFAECQQKLFGDRTIIDVTWNEPVLLEEVCCLQNSCIILVLHNGFAHGTRRISYSEKKLAAVVAFPEIGLEFFRENKVNRPEDIQIIPVNRETLLRLTKVAKENKAMICAPDAVNPQTGRCDLLSLGMFQLAQYTNVPLYFLDFRMDDDCILRGFIRGPVDYSAGPVKAAEEFISFCQFISGRSLRIMNKEWGRAPN